MKDFFVCLNYHPFALQSSVRCERCDCISILQMKREVPYSAKDVAEKGHYA